MDTPKQAIRESTKKVLAIRKAAKKAAEEAKKEKEKVQAGADMGLYERYVCPTC